MIPFRIQVKFFLENPEGIDLSAFEPVFQRWIQQDALKELLIYVADYRHVSEGPAIVLIGHESDYAVEKRDGRIGLLYTRKRQLDPDLQTQFRTALRHTLAACELLETEASFKPKLKFRADEIEIRFADRLQLPNRPETLDLVKGDLQTVLTELYGTGGVKFAPVSHDPRYLFTVAVHGEGITGITELLHHVQPSAAK